MQVYHPTKDLYLFRDKYYGRALDAEGFERSLRDFFFDGERVVEEVVRGFIGRMEKMRRAVLQWTKGRRFYSSSLLLVYEGDRTSRGEGQGEAMERTTSTRQESEGGLSILSGDLPIPTGSSALPTPTTPIGTASAPSLSPSSSTGHLSLSLSSSLPSAQSSVRLTGLPSLLLLLHSVLLPAILSSPE